MRGCSREAVTSFYFSHFPDRIKSCDMFKLFACIGEVVEVVISPRRNKWGRRFSFARFSRVDDIRVLGVRLDNIMIDGSKFHANRPRFNRRGVPGEGFGDGSGMKEVKFNMVNYHKRCMVCGSQKK